MAFTIDSFGNVKDSSGNTIGTVKNDAIYSQGRIIGKVNEFGNVEIRNLGLMGTTNNMFADHFDAAFKEANKRW